jgi:glucokinase
MAVIAIDLGGTKAAAALFNVHGRAFHKEVRLLEKREGKEVGSLISAMARELATEGERAGHRIDALGICVPGISYHDAGTVWAPNIPGWTEYPLREEIRAAVSQKGINVVIDSDRACSIWGEVWQGAAHGARDAIFLSVGTGIGAGILSEGKILRGAHDIAGAIGWLALERPFREEFASCGCFEHYASGEGIAKAARALLAGPTGGRGMLASKAPEEITSYDVFNAYDAHDPVAELVLGRCIELWGMAAANLVSLFNPEKIIFGGGIFGPAVRFLGAIREEARKWAQPISMTRVTFEPSLLGSDAGLYGAGFIALQSLSQA